jgi:signal transduction histidine kinase
MGKLGLVGMQERVQLIGGRLEVSSKPGKGTTVTIIIPNKTAMQNKFS